MVRRRKGTEEKRASVEKKGRGINRGRLSTAGRILLVGEKVSSQLGCPSASPLDG